MKQLYKDIAFAFILSISIVFSLYFYSEIYALERILSVQQEENDKLKLTLTETVKACGDAWLDEPVGEELKRRLK